MTKTETDVPQLKFAEDHIEPILKGQKTVTFRLDIDYEDFLIGRRFHLVNEGGERFASAIVKDRGYERIERIAKNRDIEGHRSYSSVDELMEEMRGYYPEEDIGPETLLEIIYWDWEDLWE